MATRTYICAVCGNQFQGLQHLKRKFCSRECSHKGRAQPKAPMRIAQCFGCGRVFEVLTRRNSKGNQRRYCSRKCANQINNKRPSNPKTSLCIQCGKMVKDRPGIARKFCSHRCKGAWQADNLVGEQNPNYAGGSIEYYGPNWYKQRNKARKRDRYRCQHCHITEKRLKRELDVHHITPFKAFGVEQYKEANHLSNLISLCPRCHKFAEHGRIALQIPLPFD